MKILGIESSCDETAAALVEIKGGKVFARSNVIASQAKLHAKYGGVVPEVAARKHVEAILPVIAEALSNHEYTNHRKYTNEKELLNILKKTPDIDAIAVTAGPGLVTSLLVGAETARVLSYIWRKPLIAVNHLEGHVYSSLLPNERIMTKAHFPMLALIVSGGHTEIVLMKDHAHYKIIGETRDDAAGEAFDKVAKMLGLAYPGGPEVSKQASIYKGGNSSLKFPRPMMAGMGFFSAKGGPASGWDFSFAGLKTAVLYSIQKMKPEEIKKRTPEICAEFQNAAVEVLVSKTIAAAKKHKVKTILLGGGVAANKQLREQLGVVIESALPKVCFQLPSNEYIGDNAAMIAVAGYFHILRKDFTPWQKLDVDANWTIGEEQSRRS